MKNQKLSLLAVVSACLLALFGCAPTDSDSPSSGTTAEEPLAELQGNWSTGCYFRGTDLNLYAKSTFKVSGTDVEFRADYYSDASCSTKTYRYSGTATNLSIGENVITSDGTSARRMNYLYETYEYTTLSSTYTELFNSISFCGASWIIDTPVDVMGDNCSGFVIPPKNSSIFNLYKLTGNNLHLSSPNTSTYPTTLNTILYVKQ
jgi:hypothetical protein